MTHVPFQRSNLPSSLKLQATLGFCQILLPGPGALFSWFLMDRPYEYRREKDGAPRNSLHNGLLHPPPWRPAPLSNVVSYVEHLGLDSCVPIYPFLSDLSFFVLLKLSRFFRDFPDFLGDFSDLSFSSFSAEKGTYKEHSRKGLRHNQDLSPKVGKPPVYLLSNLEGRGL